MSATVRPGAGPDHPIDPVVAVAPQGRRRRPSGEAPPLPRQVGGGTRAYGAVVLATLALEAALLVRPVRAMLTSADLVLLRAIEQVRLDGLTELGAVVLRVADVVVRMEFWATLLILLVLRRIHHLTTFLAVTLGSSLAVALLALLHARMRPAGLVVAGHWEGFAHPSVPVALLAVVTAAAVRTLLPAGRPRRRGLLVAGVVLSTVAVTRLYLGVDHPSDLVAAFGLGWALPMTAFGLLLPDEAFPIRYQGGRRAHVDLDGARGAAVLRALQEQLGLDAVELEPFGLSGSAGSMPMRIHLAGSDRMLFGKLCTVTHLRSDRWYKLGRMVLYGRLEDEKPFSTVRRLVEYEDHMLRLLRDDGLPVPAPHGLVEITPEREYVVVMEFLAGAREVGDVQLTDGEIDDGLLVVRRLWQAGVAHRDLKPSNLLVRDGHVLLIDVAFATVRPTPWRQAVDLANMMLTLALSSSAERVYDRALRQFAVEDVAEAFAASRSITVPTQLRDRLRKDGRDLAARFRALAPTRPPVAIQLWSVRRVLAGASVVAGVAVALTALLSYARVANLL